MKVESETSMDTRKVLVEELKRLQDEGDDEILNQVLNVISGMEVRSIS